MESQARAVTGGSTSETGTMTASPLSAYLADPSLLAVGGRFFLYPTIDGLQDWASTSFDVYSSEDLVEWVREGEALRLGRDVSWAQERAWAPAALHHDGVFYLYFSADDNVGVARSDRPEGPFVDIGHPLVAKGAFSGRAIDPSVFVDDDGSTWLFWGNTVAHAVRLAEDLVSYDPAEVVSWTPTAFCEALTVHRQGDTYFASWSENDTRHEDYRVLWAHGPSPIGPWTDGGVLLRKVPELGILATGHHAVLRLPEEDGWVIAYHRFAIPGGDGFHREIVFDRLEHTADGRLLPVIPTLESFRASAVPR